MDWVSLQRNFKNAVESGPDAGLLAELNPGAASLGMKVYRDAYYIRMREFLEIDFPQTFSRWKDAESRAIVKGYVSRYPSSSPVAADFGAFFPEYLAERKWSAEKCYIADLAALEWALVRARNAPILERTGFEQMATAGESEWGRARFRFDSAMQIVESQWPLVELYDDPNAKIEKGSYRFLVYRDEKGPMFRLLEEGEFEWLTALQAGLSLGELCDKSRTSPDQDVFSDWIASGLIAAIEWRSASA